MQVVQGAASSGRLDNVAVVPETEDQVAAAAATTAAQQQQPRQQQSVSAAAAAAADEAVAAAEQAHARQQRQLAREQRRQAREQAEQGQHQGSDPAQQGGSKGKEGGEQEEEDEEEEAEEEEDSQAALLRFVAHLRDAGIRGDALGLAAGQGCPALQPLGRCECPVVAARRQLSNRPRQTATPCIPARLCSPCRRQVDRQWGGPLL